MRSVAASRPPDASSSMQIVAAADVRLADKNLRHRAPAAARDHLARALRGARRRRSLRTSTPLRLRAAAAPARNSRTSRSSTSRLSPSSLPQPLRSPADSRRATRADPPRRFTALVKPCRASWRAADPPSEPVSQYTSTGFSLYFFNVSPAVRIWSDGNVPWRPRVAGGERSSGCGCRAPGRPGS